MREIKSHAGKHEIAPQGGGVNRRTFCRTVATIFSLPVQTTLKGISAAMTEGVSATIVSATKILIPNFQSAPAVRYLQSCFGADYKALLGIPAEVVFPEMLRMTAKNGLPYFLYGRATGRNDFELAARLHGEFRKASNDEELMQFAMQEDFEHGGKYKTVDEYINHAMHDEEIQDDFIAQMDQTIVFEILGKALPKIQPLITKIVDRKMLLFPDVSRLYTDVDQESYAGHALEKALLEEVGIDKDTYRNGVITEYLFSDEKMKEMSERVSMAANPLQQSFLHYLEQEIESGLRLFRLCTQLQQKNQLDCETEDSIGEDTDVPIGEIIESIQEPFARLLSQIQLLADPNYERTWEHPISPQVHE